MTGRDESRRPRNGREKSWASARGESGVGTSPGEKIEFDISVRFSSAARAPRVKISARFHPPSRRVRNEDFLSTRAPPFLRKVFPPLIPPSRVKGGGRRGRVTGGRRRKRREREECEMAAAARYPEAGPEKVVGERPRKKPATELFKSRPSRRPLPTRPRHSSVCHRFIRRDDSPEEI